MESDLMLKYIPILISVFSLIVAGISLGWNIYRDLILKGRLKVGFSIVILMAKGQQGKEHYVNLRVTNFGPGEVICNMVCYKYRPLFVLSKKDYSQGIIIHDYTNPLSAQLPNKLKVGDTIQILFPYNKDSFLKDKMTHIGVCDSFGRYHYAPKKDFQEARKTFRKDFNTK